MKKIALLSFILASAVMAREIDLQEAVDTGLKNNRSLIQKNIDVRQKDLKERAKFKEALPTLSASSTYSGYEEPSTQGEGFQNGITLSQPVFKGGKIYYGIREAKLNRELEEFNLFQSQKNLKLNIIKNYVAYLQLEKNLQVYEESYREKSQEAAREKEFLRVGLVDESEVLRIETSMYQTAASITETKNKMAAQKLSLKNILGMDLNEELELKGIDFKGINLEDIDMAGDISKSLENGVASKILEKNVDIADALKEQSKSVFYPQITATGGYETLKESSYHDSNEDWQWKVGVGVEWKLFNFGSDVDNYKTSKLDVEKSRVSQKDGLETLKEQITTAYLDMVSKRDTMKTNGKALESSEATYKIDREKFANRLVDSIDFLKTESELRSAQITYQNSQLDYYLAYENYLTLIK